jgi:hypothetical protein
MSSIDNARFSFDLIDTPGISLFQLDPLEMHNTFTIPAVDVAGKSIVDVFPRLVPEFFRTSVDTDIPLFRSDTGALATNLTGVSAEVAAVPEPGSIVIWSLLGAAGAGSWYRRKRSPTAKPTA